MWVESTPVSIWRWPLPLDFVCGCVRFQNQCSLHWRYQHPKHHPLSHMFLHQIHLQNHWRVQKTRRCCLLLLAPPPLLPFSISVPFVKWDPGLLHHRLQWFVGPFQPWFVGFPTHLGPLLPLPLPRLRPTTTWPLLRPLLPVLFVLFSFDFCLLPPILPSLLCHRQFHWFDRCLLQIHEPSIEWFVGLAKSHPWIQNCARGGLVPFFDISRHPWFPPEEKPLNLKEASAVWVAADLPKDLDALAVFVLSSSRFLFHRWIYLLLPCRLVVFVVLCVATMPPNDYDFESLLNDWHADPNGSHTPISCFVQWYQLLNHQCCHLKWPFPPTFVETYSCLFH